MEVFQAEELQKPQQMFPQHSPLLCGLLANVNEHRKDHDLHHTGSSSTSPLKQSLLWSP